MTPTREDIDDVLYLIKRSDYHKNYNLVDIENYFSRPMRLGQYIILRDEGRLPIVFGSWAFPNHDQISIYLQNLTFPPDGYDGGGEIPWLVDFIAEGGKRNIALGFRKAKSVLSSRGCNRAFWLRTETQKLGFHDWG